MKRASLSQPRFLVLQSQSRRPITAAQSNKARTRRYARIAQTRTTRPVLLAASHGAQLHTSSSAHSSTNIVSTDPAPGPNIPGLPEPEDEQDGSGRQRRRSKDEKSRDRDSKGGEGRDGGGQWSTTAWKMFESAATTLASVVILGIVGYSYTRYYKQLVFRKMEHAFEPGDPMLELAARGKRHSQAGAGAQSSGGSSNSSSGTADDAAVGRIAWIDRPEQAVLDAIVGGDAQGRYYLVLGEKGTGKSSMLLEAMRKIEGEGVSMFDAHADLEIFRIRLGKALDFEFHEDNIGSLFSIRGPRDASALLDIERALNKLEKVALKHRRRRGRPLVLIINSLHLLRDDEDGRDLMELLQQRAEQWAAANLCTMVFNSDDYWVYERLKVLGTRMEVLPVQDLNRAQAMTALRLARRQFFAGGAVGSSGSSSGSGTELGRVGDAGEEAVLEQVYERVGGRLSFLNRAAREPDMLAVCDDICRREKQWFLNQCWILGEEMDDDVMDQQKYAASAMLLARALVAAEAEAEAGAQDGAQATAGAEAEAGSGADAELHAEAGHAARGEAGRRSRKTAGAPPGEHHLPQIPLHKAREIMTRADFIRTYDHVNLFTIDARANVRADSVPMQTAFREICAEPGFDAFLEATLDRISAIESLGRTREVVLKDLVLGGKYRVRFDGSGGAGVAANAGRMGGVGGATFELEMPPDEPE